MGNAPPLCPPICDTASADDDNGSGSNGYDNDDDLLQQKLAAYGEPNHVNYRCQGNSFKMIVPTQMLHGRQGLRLLGFEYRTTSDRSANATCRQLYHIATDTRVSSRNVRMYIPDCLFDEIARCCQDIAQDILIQEGSLERLMVRNDDGTRVAALVDEDFCLRHHSSRISECEENKSLDTCSATEDGETVRPTLLVINGRGHSRAGIFSRKQLMVSGIEAATALNAVDECRKRRMRVILMDHLSPGVEEEMSVFESSLDAIFGGNEDDRWHSPSSIPQDSHGPIYIWAHSASGGKLVRSLLDGNARRYLLPRIHGIAFTDSTHNIQWARGVKRVWNLLESSRCIYVRSNMVRSDTSWEDGDESRRAGDVVQTDEYWQHRFGNVRTVWAGTEKHSLMNWVARGVIWNHFDDLLQESHHW